MIFLLRYFYKCQIFFISVYLYGISFKYLSALENWHIEHKLLVCCCYWNAERRFQLYWKFKHSLKLWLKAKMSLWVRLSSYFAVCFSNEISRICTTNICAQPSILAHYALSIYNIWWASKRKKNAPISFVCAKIRTQIQFAIMKAIEKRA